MVYFNPMQGFWLKQADFFIYLFFHSYVADFIQSTVFIPVLYSAERGQIQCFGDLWYCNMQLQ